jgi:hypothetical protein
MRSDELGGQRHERRNEYRGKWAPSPYPDVPTHLSSRCGAKPRYARCRGCSVPSNRAASYFPRPSARPRLSPRMSAAGSCRRPSEVRRLVRPPWPTFSRGHHVSVQGNPFCIVRKTEWKRAGHPWGHRHALGLKRLKRMLLATSITKHGRAVPGKSKSRASACLAASGLKAAGGLCDMIASAGPDL